MNCEENKFIETYNFLNEVKRKDKTQRCKNCGKVGHSDQSCVQQNKIHKKYCHVCISQQHDSLNCEYQKIKCNKCNLQGHLSQNCKLSSNQLSFLNRNSWNINNNNIEFTSWRRDSHNEESPRLQIYKRFSNVSNIFEFDFDRLVLTDFQQLIQIAQQQFWIQNFYDNKKIKLWIANLNEIIEKNYIERERNLYTDKYDHFLENPPLPSRHHILKIYCPKCTQEHEIQDCKNQNRNQNDNTLIDFNKRNFKGKSKRMAKFMQHERLMDMREKEKLHSQSDSKIKSEKQFNKNEIQNSKQQKEEKNQDWISRLKNCSKTKQMSASLEIQRNRNFYEDQEPNDLSFLLPYLQN